MSQPNKFPFKRMRKSILFKLLIPLLIFLLLQSTAILVVFYGSGMVTQSSQNSYTLFQEKVTTRRNYLQDELAQRHASFNNQMTELTAVLDGITNKDIEQLNSQEFDHAFLTQSLGILVDTIKTNSVTGAYIILNTQAQSSGNLNAVYIRCEEPSNAGRYSIFFNIVMESVANSPEAHQISSANTSDFFVANPSNEQNNYFFKPFNAAKNAEKLNAEEYNHYAYWARPHNVNQKIKKMVVSCSIPLIYQNKVIGVFGIDVSLNYLDEHLPSRELSNLQNSSYVLADRASGASFNTVTSTGTLFARAAENDDVFDLVKDKKPFTDEHYLLKNSSNKDTVVCLQPLNLYEPNAYFKDNVFYLSGMATSNELFAFSRRMTNTVLISFIMTDIVGVALIALISVLISRPVSRLTQKIRGFTHSEKGKLDRTGILEIDELIESIESLSLREQQHNLKMSKIIELSGVPLGAFEFDEQDGSATFTNKVAEVLDNPDMVSGKCDAVAFKKYLQLLDGKRISSDEYDALYYFIDAQGTPRYVAMRTTIVGSRTIGVAQNVSQHMIEKARIEYERDHDVLTGLLNRRAFMQQAGKIVASEEGRRFGALVMMDLDNLKIINDTFGHEQGDEYIRMMAKSLKNFIAEGKNLVSRLSGDEFVMLLHEYPNAQRVNSDIARLKQYLTTGYMIMANKQKMRTRCSAGVTYYPQDTTDLNDMIRYADFAMYQVKQNSKGEVNEFNALAYAKREYSSHNYDKFNSLLDDHLIEYFFQAIVDVTNGEVMGYEALMRSKDVELGTPPEILALARVQHKLHIIERFTWVNSIASFYAYANKIPNVKLFLNSIPSHVIDPESVQIIEQNYASVLSRVVVEFTEEEKINEEMATEKKNIINRWGGMIALDDFGAGYSNDTLLLTLEPDFVKIDMFIVRDVNKDRAKRKLVENMVAYALERKIKVIAEGVETLEEVTTLLECGVNYIQGFYFSKPSKAPQDIADELKKQLKSIYKEVNGRV